MPKQTEDKAKLDWLRRAVQDGIDQLERGEGIAYAAMNELSRDIDSIRDEVLAGIEK